MTQSFPLALFAATFFAVAVTPGMCMTLALTLGMSVGLRRTLWMMGGEMLGVGSICLATGAGVAAVLLANPAVFTALKLVGGAYLAWCGIQAWRSRGSLAMAEDPAARGRAAPLQLFAQGFLTAIANPKGWAFMLALLPPFIDPARALAPQLALLIGIILPLEFISMLAYAAGGRALRGFLQGPDGVVLVNRIAGTLMIGVAVWLVLD